MSNQQALKILTVDDDVMNLEIMVKNLNDAGYESVPFEDGDYAWDYLLSNPKAVDVVLLDKMMPRMDGIELLRLIKEHSELKKIPVIIQTGDIGSKETKNGLDAGAFYYLEKPFDPNVMIAVVDAAIRESDIRNNLLSRLKRERSAISMLEQGQFRLRSIEQAKDIAIAFAQPAVQSEEVCIALSEILMNAVEHGNLEIGYEKKSALLKENMWEKEIQKRLQDSRYNNRWVTIDFNRRSDYNELTITDQGQGFQWKKYMMFDPLRLTDPNGRGIAIASILGLQLEYHGCGNVVTCRYKVATNE